MLAASQLTTFGSTLPATSLLASSLALTGCLQWQEAPEGATGFLVVEDARLEGTVNGVAIDPATTSASGHCTPAGWYLELSARAGGANVIAAIDVRDVDMGQTAEVRFVPAREMQHDLVAGDALDDDVGAGRMQLMVCAGQDTARPEFEHFANHVVLDLAAAAPDAVDVDVEVEYQATFENGDQVDASFSMEMPIVD